jgi:hypothetical protein
VAFTVVAVWLGWNVHVVRQRFAFLDHIDATGQMHGRLHPPFPDAGEMKAMAMDVPLIAQETFGEESYTQYPPLSPGPLSTVRLWLGDQPCLYIAYWSGPDTDRIRRLFAEAIILVSDRPYEEAASAHGSRIPAGGPSP